MKNPEMEILSSFSQKSNASSKMEFFVKNQNFRQKIGETKFSLNVKFEGKKNEKYHQKLEFSVIIHFFFEIFCKNRNFLQK